jgi:hypothetical protein
MYIASADLSLPLNLQSWSDDGIDSKQRLRVAPPRHQPAGGDIAETVQQLMPTDATRALRAELGVAIADLTSKTAELKQAKQLLKCVTGHDDDMFVSRLDGRPSLY